MVRIYVYTGQPDHYYVRGRMYDLEVRRGIFGKVKITAVHGYEDKYSEGSDRVYRNWDIFMEDWKRP